MNAKDLKEFAQLAQAAYGDFSSSAIRNGQQLKLELPHKDFGKFAPAEAALFTEWEYGVRSSISFPLDVG